eukprot:TRINITY_DN4356_c0_g3_i1.p1 TRINITY_DN4356_c0_g3~~TRINITY_DN4356_c0_g3_i1.p1  ORF type:complete len:444 (-),score=83.20 TRINITY_DN4356_c0_g3_i1:929-2260(-)
MPGLGTCRFHIFARLRRRTMAAIWDRENSYVRKELLPCSQAALTDMRDNPHCAVFRAQAVAELTRFLQDECKGLRIRLKGQPFIRWLYNQMSSGPDMLLPSRADDVDAGLHAELLKERVSDAVASNVCIRLAAEARKYAAKLALLRPEEPPCSTAQATVEISGDTVTVSYSEQRYKLHKAYYEKLQVMYRRVNGPGSETTPVFDNALFCLLARYTTLSGTGLQAALPECVFNAIRDQFGVRMECFASPLNCRFGTLCSAFLDTDGPFGSVGSFFLFRPTKGAFEVNPPFVEGLMLQMAQHIQQLLDATTESLTFLIYIPGWTDTPCWPILKQSRWLRWFTTVKKGEHGYIVGDQHTAEKRYLPATADTALFLMQSDLAAKQRPATMQRCDAVLKALRDSLPTLSESENVYYESRYAEKRVRDLQEGRPHATDASEYEEIKRLK